MKLIPSPRILTFGAACVAACALTVTPAVTPVVAPAALAPLGMAPALAAPGAQSAWDRETPIVPSAFTVDSLPTV